MCYSGKVTRVASFMLFLAAVLCFAMIAAVPCRAATWTVTTSADDGSTESLRGAIASADSGDIISFNIGSETTIILSGDLGQLEISKDLTILGPGSDDLSISGGGACRCFYIHECSVDISGLSVISCDAAGVIPAPFGGGIYCQSADLTLKDCSFNDNSSTVYGGGIYCNSAVLTMEDCYFSNNASNAPGGGMCNQSVSMDIVNCTFNDNTAGANGGGMYNSSVSMDITGCTFSGNNASSGPGGGMYNQSVSMDIVNCTFGGNTASAPGGGIYNESVSMDVANCTFSGNNASSGPGGGIYNQSVSMDIANCTFSGNTASAPGGGIYNVSTSADIINCTFSSNIADETGSGICSTGSDATVANCILWDRGSSEIYASDKDRFTIGYCVVSGDVSSADCTISGDIIIDDPMLGDLSDNGGDTKTCALLSGSSAIDAGTAEGAPEEDQRGITRPQGNGYDIGAYEYETTDNSGSSGCSIGYVGPAALLLFVPLCLLLKKK